MEDPKAPHVAILPSPGMGHLIPLVQFAKQLVHRHTFSVTFLVIGEGPPSNSQRTVLNSLPSSISSVFLPPADLTDLPPTTRIETRISLTVSRSNAELRRVFESLAAEGRSPTVLLVDLFGTDAFDVALEFHVSPYIFFPPNANVLSFFLHLPKLHQTMSCEFSELTEPVQLPGCVPFAGKEAPDPARDRKHDVYKCLLHNAKRYKEAEGILVNTFLELEPNALKALQEPGLGKPPVYPIGPLVNIGKQEGSNRTEESECLKWLDKQPLDSEQRFLWVIRSPSQIADASFFSSHSEADPLTFLPPGFLERTKDRGFMISSWAPQVQILAHTSTGGFLSHCGWNSTLESIVNGVPLIAWPLYAEQKMNAVLLAEDIHVALRARAGEDGMVRREEVAGVIKGLMEGEEGKSVRNKMKEMKEGASRVLSDDGSSTKALTLVALKWNDHQKGLERNGKH
ncbi:UDP-glycosyltransferase 72B1 [Raphanus sativus]|nr:UDP-glycosyltransferase 72B1 [Raphanus sativus]